MRRYIIVLLSMLAICSVPCQSQTIDRALFERSHYQTLRGLARPKDHTGLCGLWSPATEGRAFPENTDTSACRFAVTDRPPPAPAPICPLWQGCLSACHPLVPDWTSQVVRQASLLTRLERGDRDILPLYLSYCKWRGKAVASIRKRRWVEYQLLYAER